jgi:hypothetical protein
MSNINTGIDAVRKFDIGKCRRIYLAAVAMLDPEDVAFVKEWYKTTMPGGDQSPLEQTVALCRCTVPQAWASLALGMVKTAKAGNGANAALAKCLAA